MLPQQAEETAQPSRMFAAPEKCNLVSIGVPPGEGDWRMSCRGNSWSALRRAGATSVGICAALATSCASRSVQTGEAEIPEFRADVMAHLSVLAHGVWEDWDSLLEASQVVQGVFRVDRIGELRTRPDEYLDAHVDAPRVLLGAPIKGRRQFVVYNHKVRMFPSLSPSSAELERAHGRYCVVFLGGGRHLARCRGVTILPIIRESEFSPPLRRQLESFLRLATLDPVQVGRLVAKPDTEVEAVVARLRSSPGDRGTAQSCLDQLRSMGAAGVPGILHEMMKTMLEPESNDRLQNVVVSIGRHRVPRDVYDLLNCAIEDVLTGLGPVWGQEIRWRVIRTTALQLLAREFLREPTGADSRTRDE
jgi:hypothetical protein